MVKSHTEQNNMYQKIIVIGNLGRDPELRYMADGKAVTNFSIATSNTYTKQDGTRVEETTWFRISAWGKLAETCNQYLSKGRKVLVEGRLIADKETGGPRTHTKQDGSVSASFEIKADTVKFLSGKNDDVGQAGQVLAQEDSEIPF